MLQTKVVDKIKKNYIKNIFLPENRAVFEIIWKKKLYIRTGYS